MVSFEVKKDKTISVKDYWSNGPYYPPRDETEDYSDPYAITLEDSDYISFQTKRLLNTGDGSDFVIPLDKSFVMTWAGCPHSQGMNYHGGNYGWLDVKIPSEGGPASIEAQDRPSSCCCCCYG